LFWQKDHVTWVEIEKFLQVYNNDYEKDIILLFLIKAAIYRSAAPIIDAINSGTINLLNLEKRMNILKNVIGLRMEQLP